MNDEERKKILEEIQEVKERLRANERRIIEISKPMQVAKRATTRGDPLVKLH